MIIGGIDKVVEWLDLNAIESWSISTNKDKSKGDYIFKSKDDVPVKDEQARMIQTLALSNNPTLYIFGKQKGQSNAGNFCEIFTNVQSPVPAQMQSSQIGAISQESVNGLIENAIQKERMAWERKELDREREEVAQMRKEYNEAKESVIGLLIEKVAPFVSAALSGTRRAAAVGTVGQPVAAEKITPVQAAPVDAEPDEDTAEENFFTEAESASLYSIVVKWKELDPDYLSIIEKIVSFAESGEPIEVAGGLVKLNYEQIKKMIL